MNTNCGLEFIRWYPKCLQPFANANYYAVIYSLLGMLWHTMNSYFIGTISTIEKNFQMSSQTLGFITGAAELGGVLSNVLLTYYVSKKHPIRCVAFGMFITGLSCLVKVLPHHFSSNGSEVLIYTQEYKTLIGLQGSDQKMGILSNNVSGTGEDQNCGERNSDIWVFYLFVLSHFVIGVGNTLFWTCGVAYMDDNSKKEDFPLLFSITLAIRFFGQTAGYFLSSYTLRIFLFPTLTPTITNDDPKWIGAWWIGWYFISAWYFILTVVFSLFPRQLPEAAESAEKSGIDTVIPQDLSIRDFIISFKRIIQNKVIYLEAASAIFYSLGLSAYGTFLPKYMESQFEFTATKSNFILGIIGIFSKVLGIVLNGVVVSVVKPGSRFLMGFNIIGEVISAIGYLSFIFLGCSSATFQGHWNENHSWNVTEECNAYDSLCNELVKYSPVCDVNRKTEYFSPCHAGCPAVPSTTTLKKHIFENCRCLPDLGQVSLGHCPTDCTTNITIFIIILTLMNFVRGTVRGIKPLIKLRSVDKDDKAMTIGISQSILQVLGLMPAPVIYGMIMDYTCIMWEKVCGVPGKCWLYDPRRLRNVLNFTATGFLAAGIVIDCFVWYYVKRINMFDEDMEMKKIPETKINCQETDSKTNMTKL